MYATDFDEFKQSLGDLCVAVNRPFNDELARVFWDDLKTFPLSEVKQRAKYLRAGGKRQFTSHDLRPEKPPQQPASTYEKPEFQYDYLHTFAQRCLLKFALTYGPFEDRTMGMLVNEKNRIVTNFRLIAKDEQLTAEEVRERLFTGFNQQLGVN